MTESQLSRTEISAGVQEKRTVGEVKEKVGSLAAEIMTLTSQPEVDLSSLKEGEKAGVLVRAGDTDIYAQRVVALLIEKKGKGFSLQISWRTLEEGLRFKKDGRPELPANLAEILLTEDQVKGEVESRKEGASEWFEWTLKGGSGKRLFMGYAETFLKNEQLIGSRVILAEAGELWAQARAMATVDLGRLEPGRLVAPEPWVMYDLKLPPLPFTEEVFGSRLWDERILWVGKSF